MGGSVGISFVTTMLSRRAQVHQNFLSAHVTEYDPQLRQMFAGATQMLMEQGSSAYEAAMQAKALIYNLVKQQAVMLAFIDNSWFLATAFIIVIPLVFLMKRTAPHKDAPRQPAQAENL